MWTCTECGEQHEDSFDACWKCGSARDQTAIVEEASDSPAAGAACMKCGGAMEAGMVVEGRHNPITWFAESVEMMRLFSLFNDKPHFYLTANRCGDCGYLELYAKA
jgi:hypothetical protein